MTTKEHKEMARRLAVRGIEAYKKRLILEEDLLNGEDKRHILDEIAVISHNIKFDKVGQLERELAVAQKRVQELEAKINWLHSLEDCDEEFEI